MEYINAEEKKYQNFGSAIFFSSAAVLSPILFFFHPLNIILLLLNKDLLIASPNNYLLSIYLIVIICIINILTFKFSSKFFGLKNLKYYSFYFGIISFTYTQVSIYIGSLIYNTDLFISRFSDHIIFLNFPWIYFFSIWIESLVLERIIKKNQLLN
jgi:hypothetical protein